MSDKQCRKILEDEDCDYSDEEIQKIKSFLYKMAEVVIDTIKLEKND